MISFHHVLKREIFVKKFSTSKKIPLPVMKIKYQTEMITESTTIALK